ncbi:hypothetical protein BC792_108133 [Sphingobacterium allocomposti]|uniref:Beta-galactosidase-like protein n=1 Tax=Sphingobacterium allocomposti TaxID=415956 RepID=A0A5S5DJH5_9SPHI|nr:hypothetical protein [Sphingobacterium composti Yoo et al. 2007 non Ten et al. 2007]TYP96041.1 hypothetical protein BC792_108133 [Sphingobacterium composti Yoo et al. 2007 non Ten et al. 2007]
MINRTYIGIACLLGSCGPVMAQQTTDKVKTTFQTSREWRPTIDNRADAVMIYGVGGNPSDRHRRVPFPERVKSWKDRGYTIHFMTGIAWGEYQDYFTGQWDGKWHLDEGQVTQAQDTIWHGHMVPYIVPTDNFLNYLKEKHVKPVIDAGIDAIFMEEPEFWARGGYSEAFKREWKKYYGFDWRPQHESPENTYLSNKLKYQLYYKALNEVFTFAKEYGKSKGMDVKCYVPTHSLVNYAQWMIVSPEASLASLPVVDGYIAQVWTGTSREPNYFNGKEKERVFETAYLEYGSMESMTAPTGRKMFFLTDPIEDRAKDWVDYKTNYQATFVAQLLYPKIADYEVMPWPERIYEGLYRTDPNSDRKERIPRHYSTQMQVMINSLNQMPLSENKLSGSEGISVLMANSLMFQRFPTHEGYDDPQLANFYGLALPFLKRGVPVKTVHIENLGYAGALADTKVLLMTYANMKPLDPIAHDQLAAWVKAGGQLVYSGTDRDPFQTVQEWWNTGANRYKAPADHLFGKMGIAAGAKEGLYAYGKGSVQIIRTDPKEYAMRANASEDLIRAVQERYRTAGGSLAFKNSFYLRRGPFELVAVMDESVSEEHFTINGTLIDLFDPKLPVYPARTIAPGEQGYFMNVDLIKNKHQPQVLAAAYRVYDEEITGNNYSYVAKSPIETTGISRVLLPRQPRRVKVNGQDIFNLQNWDAKSGTYLLGFENNPDGVKVEFAW